eukprot:493095_1
MWQNHFINIKQNNNIDNFSFLLYVTYIENQLNHCSRQLIFVHTQHFDRLPSKMPNILNILSVNDENGMIIQELNQLFGDNDKFAKMDALKRLKLILKIYRIWINKKDKMKNVNFIDGLNDGLSK